MALISKSQQLANYLKNAIQSGRWASGAKLPGEFELREEFQVSRTTVRDALATLANDGIIVRKHGIGTFISEKIPGSNILITADARRLSSLMGYWFRVLVEEAQSLVSDSGYKAVLAVGHGETDEEFLSSVNLESVDCEFAGAIDISSRVGMQQYILNAGIPLVQVESATSTCTYAAVLDYAKLTSIAVSEMNRFGHSDFALMHYSFGASEMQDSVYAEFDRLIHTAVNNSKDRLIGVPGHPDASLAYDVFKEWWNRPNRPDAIYFYDDSLFDVASRAILELGIRVPDDLAVLTHANVGRAIHFPARMCRLGFDPAVVMAQAWAMLNQVIVGEPVFDPIVKIHPVYVEGDSLCMFESTEVGGDARNNEIKVQ